MSYKKINMFDKITCDKCGLSQVELSVEASNKFFDAGWSLDMNARKHKNKCGKCNGKNQPSEKWKAIEPILVKYPLIRSINTEG